MINYLNDLLTPFPKFGRKKGGIVRHIQKLKVYSIYRREKGKTVSAQFDC